MLIDAIAADLPYLQAEARSMMTISFSAYSPGATVLDENDIEVPGYTPEGPTCGKFQGGSSSTKDAETRMVSFGGVERPVMVLGLHIPLCSYIDDDGQLRIVPGDQNVGWELEVDAVGPRNNPGLIGRRFLVIGVPAKSYATARRLDVTEVS